MSIISMDTRKKARRERGQKKSAGRRKASLLFLSPSLPFANVSLTQKKRKKSLLHSPPLAHQRKEMCVEKVPREVLE